MKDILVVEDAKNWREQLIDVVEIIDVVAGSHAPSRGQYNSAGPRTDLCFRIVARIGAVAALCGIFTES